MVLSKTAWNNVIIFSVMIIVLLINTTNERLFSKNSNEDNTLLLPEHSVVLALSIGLSTGGAINFERIGKAWQMTSQGVVVDLTNQQIEQTMFAWQESRGLVQAADIIIDTNKGVDVLISLANIEKDHAFTLYALTDQLLIYNHQKQLWLSLPAAISRQLIPHITTP